MGRGNGGLFVVMIICFGIGGAVGRGWGFDEGFEAGRESAVMDGYCRANLRKFL